MSGEIVSEDVAEVECVCVCVCVCVPTSVYFPCLWCQR